jgi:hypothetical protein
MGLIRFNARDFCGTQFAQLAAVDKRCDEPDLTVGRRLFFLEEST